MLVEAAGAKLHVAHDGGSADGVPLLLLHGFAGTAATWGPLLPDLTMHARCVAPDLVGHGRSAAPPDPAAYTMESCVAQLCGVLDALRIERADWLGYSMGGRVALHAALLAPERVHRLVLEGASPGIRDAAEREARRKTDEALAFGLERDGVEAFLDHWLQQPIFASQRARGAAWMEQAKAARRGHKARGLANSLRGMGQGAQEPLWDRLGEVRQPALLVHGALDERLAPAHEAMARAMPDARLAVLPGAGHEAHAEEPEGFTRAVLGFLA